MTNQLGSEQNGDVIDVLPPVAGCLLSFQIGVDRHLGNAASSDGIDEVDRSGAALRSDQVTSRIGDLEVHTNSQSGNDDGAKDPIVPVVCTP